MNGLTSSAIDPKMSATDTSNWRTQLYGLKAHRFDTNGAVYYYETGAESQIRFALDTISEEVKESTTTFTLDENSVLSCAFPENGQFDLANALEQSVAVKTVGITMNADGTVSESDTPTVLSNAKINTSDNTVTVSGFAYSDYYVTADHAGQKLIVEISGLKPHKAGRLSADGDSAVYKVTPETGETLQVASFPGVSDCYVPLEPKVQDFSTSFTVTDNMLNYNDATGAMTRSNGAFQFAKPNLTFQLNKLNLSNEGGTLCGQYAAG